MIPAGAEDLATSLLGVLEGCRLKPYLDMAGIPTIGIGCTRFQGEPVTLATPAITMAQAEDQFHLELTATAAFLARMVEVEITAGQWAAMASLSYNVGGRTFASSGVLKFTNGKLFKFAAEAFMLFDKVRIKGVLQRNNALAHRRAIESSVYSTGKMPTQPIASAVSSLRPITVMAHASTADELNEAELNNIQGSTSR